MSDEEKSGQACACAWEMEQYGPPDFTEELRQVRWCRQHLPGGVEAPGYEGDLASRITQAIDDYHNQARRGPIR